MAVYELVTHINFFEVLPSTPQQLNVYTFVDEPDPTVTGDVDALIDAFEEVVVPALQVVMSTNSNLHLIQGRNVYDPTMFEDRVVDYNGTSGGENPPPFAAVLIRSQRPAIGVRRLKKFFPLANEAQQQDGRLTGTAQTQFQALADILADPIEDSSSGRDFRLVLARKEKYVVPGSSPVRYAWRYFGTQAEQLANVYSITDLFVKPEITTMRSRMFGRGI